MAQKSKFQMRAEAKIVALMEGAADRRKEATKRQEMADCALKDAENLEDRAQLLQELIDAEDPAEDAPDAD